MFKNINDADVAQEQKFDLCIIGAGAAGITIAREFRSLKISVALLESGGLNFDQSTQDLNVGENVGIPYFSLVNTRLRYFGGTTNHWAGQSIPLDPEDFQQRSWVPDSGWPISFNEFSPFLKSAEEICGVPCGPYHWEYWRRQGEKGEIPLSRSDFDDAVFRYSSPPRRFGESYRDDIKKSDNITCYLNANVLKLETDRSGERVEKVVVASLAGKRVQIRANMFVLAGGGIENSRLLLLSDSTQKNGLGNQNDQVGRYFMEHPNFDSGVIRLSGSRSSKILADPFMEIHGSPLRLDFKLRPEIQRQEKILNHSAFLRKVKSSSKNKESDDVGMMMQIWQKVINKYDSYFPSTEGKSIAEYEYTLRLRLEHAPNAESRIMLDEKQDVFGLAKVKLDIRLGELEGRTIERIQKYLAKDLGYKSLGRMQITFNKNSTQWKNNLGWQYHHCGGTRMHDSPKKGVVDRNCRVHGLSNLYIAGSSVFTTSGHANPTMNIVALSLRLSEHLKKEL